ncbi:ATP-binding protein [Arthrobacter sp. MDT3-24]
MSHNLEALTPFDFESLAKTVLDAELQINLEIYKSGKDQGIDLRHAWKDEPAELIVQCKHTPGATIRSLRRQFTVEELPKVRKLGPSRYVIFTSAQLSKANKSGLRSDMTPYVLADSDIYGRQQIEHFLEANPEAVRSHLRLWLTSSSVLRAVLNQEIAVRSSDLLQRIESQLSIFVDTAALPRAQDVLRRRRVCLISGPPGIGKTTLAQILCAELIADGYEAILISSRISEALNVWQEDKKQVFVFDDFLGRSAKGDILDRNEDEDIPRFAEKVFASPNKCFIMTTRGYILGQARNIYERLSRPSLKLAECLLELEDLDTRSRAMILYNHVWASDLEPLEKALFAERSTYWPILGHRNYSPRLVSLSLELHSQALDDANLSAPELMLRNLDNPMELWRHAITRDLPDDARTMLDLFGTLGARVNLTRLRDIWRATVDTGDEATGEDRFETILSVLEGDFLSVEGPHADPVLTTANPSIDDFMAYRLRNRKGLLMKLLRETPSHRHVEGIQRLFSTRLSAGRVNTKNNDWEGSLRPMVFTAYRRLLFALDPLIQERRIDIQENLRRLARLWSVARDGEELQEAVKLTDGLVAGLEDGTFYVEWDCIDDLVGLLVELESFDGAKNIYELLLKEVESVVTQSLDGWESAREALSHIERLSTHSSRMLQSQIEERIDDIVREQLGSWADLPGDNEGEHTGDLEGVLEYASMYTDPDEVFPGYERANTYVNQAATSHELNSGNLWAAKGLGSETDFDVAALMDGLR